MTDITNSWKACSLIIPLLLIQSHAVKQKKCEETYITLVTDALRHEVMPKEAFSDSWLSLASLQMLVVLLLGDSK